MATEITMPKLSDTMTEGTILKWHVAVGDRVARGDIIAEAETDKAAMEMEAFEDGTVTELRVAEGTTVAVGTVIAVLDGEAQSVPPAPTAPKPEPEPKPEPKPEPEPIPSAPAPSPASRPAAAAARPAAPAREMPSRRDAALESRVAAASPAARRLARERGIDLAQVRGSGPGGRILLSDVEGAPVKTPPPAVPEGSGGGGGKSVKIRRIVARKMVESWETIPHFYVTVAVDMTDVIRFRKDLGVTINDFILAATARSLREHPWVNSFCLDGEAVEQPLVNIAMAVASERGLYNPVLRDCGNLSLRAINLQASALAERAHQGKLSQEDLKGGTFTISNMGMLGVESFTALITPPQVAVLAVGTARGEIVVDEHGETTIAPILRLTLSADHRVLDGADAAEFLGTLKSYLEAPVVLIAGGD